ncbi:uncharacterized protein LOC124539057 [Vanessa cardui]|uniref:uncharacterized protein LOC124539057 n=1 Tax=Vanessa cardui TaxID=171605 RepID=UPI001F138B3B|nr:uncharacterized protein LOC124539057 [Vanessa cardui]
MSATISNNSPGGCHSLSDPLHGSDSPVSKSGGDKVALEPFNDDHNATKMDTETEREGVVLSRISSRNNSISKSVNKEDPGLLKGLVVRLERLPESDSSVCSTETNKRRRKGEKRSHAMDSPSGSDSDATTQRSDSESTISRWLKPANKRGRGRPASHGLYVGLGRSMEELNSQKRSDQRFEVEDSLAAYNEAARVAMEERAALSRKRNSQSPSGTEDVTKTSAALDAAVQEACDVVMQVADKSGNLKGTFVRALKAAAYSIKGAVADLRALTMTEDVARLEAANAQLSGQLAELRREVAEMRKRPVTTDASHFKEIMEEALRSNREQFGNMLNARMEGIERRLLPEPRLRPPLAADRNLARTAAASDRPTTQSQSPVAPATVSDRSQAAKPAAKPKGKKKRKPTLAAQEAAAAVGNKTAPPLPSKPSSSGTSWAAVVRKQPNKPPKNPKAKTQKVEKQKAPKRRKLRPPRTAVITMTLKPGATEKGLSYETVLAQAKTRIRLSEVGLTTVRFRTAATGARILEVPPGTSDAEKAADALADRLREVLSPDEVQIHRPTKCVELRVKDLDDSVTVEEVVAAVAGEGDCAAGAIRPGAIVWGPRGSGSLWLSCPITAAKKVVEVGRIRVGWVSARVTLLEPRPLRCFRCLEGGHMGAKCDRGVDRSRLCFRCGLPDHRARDCTAAEAKCAICSAAGKPAAHAVGSKGCPGSRARPAPRKGGAVAKGPVAAPQRPAEEPMETAS